MTTIELERTVSSGNGVAPGGTEDTRLPHRTGGSGHKGHRMLSLPKRGDVVARYWAIAGVAVYVVLTLVLIKILSGSESLLALIGLGDHRNYMVGVLVISGIVLTVAGFVIVFLDIRNVAREERDVEWVHKHQRDGLVYVFADPAKREAAFRKSVLPGDIGGEVETLIDDRVRRAQSAVSNGETSSASVLELRAIAEKRTSQYGEKPRYFSSLLLLLAVLGTFAGVKTALPSLINAMSPTAIENGSAEITAPLQNVSDAFGGNALALIGAIALGLAAQGLAFGRRNLLERLELVSIEYIYRSETSGAGDPITLAAREFKVAAGELRTVGATMGGVELGLKRLNEQFGDSFERLTDDLRELIDEQDETLHLRTGQAVETLQQKVTELAQVVQLNVEATGRLFESVQDRSEGARHAVKALQVNHEQMSAALQNYAAAHKSAEKMFEEARVRVDSVGNAADRLASGAESLAPQVRELNHTLDAANSTHTHVSGLLQEMTQLAGGVQERTQGQFDVMRTLLTHHLEQLSGILDQTTNATKVAMANATVERPHGTVPVPAYLPPPRAGESDESLQTLRGIARQLHQLEDLHRSQRRTAWIISGSVLFSGLVSVAAAYFLQRYW